MDYLIKCHKDDLPIKVSNFEELDKYTKGHKLAKKFTMAFEPADREDIKLILETDPDEFEVDPKSIADDWIHSTYSCEMTYAGCPATRIDPPEGPEFDLPDCDVFEEEVTNEIANAILESAGIEDNIYSLKISDYDRSRLLEKANDVWLDQVGPWPDDYDIAEQYSTEPEPPEYEPDDIPDWVWESRLDSANI